MFNLFSKGTPNIIRSVIKVIKEYFGQEGEGNVKEALNKNVVVFSLSETNLSFRRVTEFFRKLYWKRRS